MTIYRMLLRLYPQTFLRTFGDELELDFEEGTREAAAAGIGSLLVFWVRTGADFVRSLAREWLRTPWIPVMLVAGAATIAVFNYIAYEFRRLAPYVPPPREPGAAVMTLQLIAVMTVGVLVPIVGTIFGSIWIFVWRTVRCSKPSR